MRAATFNSSQIVDIRPANPEIHHDTPTHDEDEMEKPDLTPPRQDAFGDEETAEVKYKILKWWYVFASY